MVILSNTTLYVAGYKSNTSYVNHFVLLYTELNTILIGPNAQTVHLSNYDNDMQCLIVTGCSNITGNLVGQLEMAMRKDVNRPKLPAVKQLNMRDMVNLRRAICKQTSVDKVKNIYYILILLHLRLIKKRNKLLTFSIIILLKSSKQCISFFRELKYKIESAKLIYYYAVYQVNLSS